MHAVPFVIFVLPKPNPSMTVVAVMLDALIQKRQTFYSHVLYQFETEMETYLELILTKKNWSKRSAGRSPQEGDGGQRFKPPLSGGCVLKQWV